MKLPGLAIALLLLGCGEDDPASDPPVQVGEGEGEPGADGGEGEGGSGGDTRGEGEGEGGGDQPDVGDGGEGEGEGEGDEDPPGDLVQDLCGELSGALPAGGTYTLTCPGNVPEGQTLTIGAGSSLALGTNPLGIDGTLEATDLTATAALQAGFVLGLGGELRITGGRVEVAEIEAGNPLFDVEAATLTLTDVTLVEGEERREAVRARPGATVTLNNVRFESFWIGVAFEAGAGGAVTGSTFVDCLTGVHVVGDARPKVTDSAFQGPGFHLRLAPGVFEVDREPLLSGNTFVGGVPISLSGQLTVDGELEPVDGVSRFEVLELGVAPGAALRIADDVEIALLGASIEVAGVVDIEGARFEGLLAPALRFDGGGGTITGATFSSGGAAGTALIEVIAGAPELADVTFEDEAHTAICLRTSGPDAAPIVDRSTLGCWLGVSVEQGAVTLTGSTLEGHDTGVRLETSGSTLGELTLASDGTHVSLGPGWFTDGDPDDLGLGTHDFGRDGVPVEVGGVLRGEAQLVPLVGEDPLVLTALSVRPNATLTAAPGLELRQGGTAITVDGRAELDQVLFSRLEGPAVHWRESATGHLRHSRLEFVGAGAFPGLQVTDSSPALEDNEIAGGAGGGIGVQVIGNEDVDVVAAPVIARNAFSGLRIGIHVVGDSEPGLIDNTFEDVQDQVIESEVGGE